MGCPLFGLARGRLTYPGTVGKNELKAPEEGPGPFPRERLGVPRRQGRKAMPRCRGRRTSRRYPRQVPASVPRARAGFEAGSTDGGRTWRAWGERTTRRAADAASAPRSEGGPSRRTTSGGPAVSHRPPCSSRAGQAPTGRTQVRRSRESAAPVAEQLAMRGGQARRGRLRRRNRAPRPTQIPLAARDIEIARPSATLPLSAGTDLAGRDPPSAPTLQAQGSTELPGGYRAR